MREFAYNVLKRKDEQNRDLFWEEQLSNGFQLHVELDNDDEQIMKSLDKIHQQGDNFDAKLMCKVLSTLSTKTPPILMNLRDYVMKYHNQGLVVQVPLEKKSFLYAISINQTENKILPVSWNICDICGFISDILEENKSSSKILINQNTHITSLDIRLHEIGEIGRKIIITPRIENLTSGCNGQ